MTSNARAWFVGSGSFAAMCLARMSAGVRFERVITGLPTAAGRGLGSRPSRVEEECTSNGIPVERTGPISENNALLTALLTDPPDAIFVVDFGQVIREPMLSAPAWGCLNVHPSMLPRLRGAAPVQRALMNGDASTGVTVFRLVEEMDAGPVMLQEELPIPPDATGAEVFASLADRGGELAVRALGALSRGELRAVPQNGAAATYARKLDKAEAHVSWTWSAERIHNTVRAFDFSTGAFVTTGAGKRLKLWRVSPEADENTSANPGTVLCLADDPIIICGREALRLLEVQAEGKRRMSGAEWARGARLEAGSMII
ncbi:MAG: methionyl-tRNA formyltransferase [Synergistaceae bacterium]|jgi:methionyl-tRNA formyltransferase|nr:methionyl-tRNA formyltransferase [Synergistaceae bacterium]